MKKWIKNIINKLSVDNVDSHVEVLLKKFGDCLPESYCNDNSIESIVEDLSIIQNLIIHNFKRDCRLTYFQDQGTWHIHLYQHGEVIPLSGVLPAMESLGFRILRESSWIIQQSDQMPITISRFSAALIESHLHNNRALLPENLHHTAKLLRESLVEQYAGRAFTDGFNRLVLPGSLLSADVSLLRAIAAWLYQTKFRFSSAQIEKVLLKNIDITRKIVNLFYALHDPDERNHHEKMIFSHHQDIMTTLDTVRNIDDDTIIRRYLAVVNSTVRTNFFKWKQNTGRYNALVLKIQSGDIPDMPLPCPLFDTFVWSTKFEGVHLRNQRISRGGIRWSDRVDDYRTEVLALMKAQKVKNSIIVPSGAKGGFVVRDLSESLTAAERNSKVMDVYAGFISSLLDVVDNIVAGVVVHPEGIVCRDEADPYFVVAADKGTANFSDIANLVSREHNFWLSDAFASGGKYGYDHKKMGITAKGAWESVKRHLQELGRSDDVITTVGIGDMGGDVFGNGMLCSPNISLVAAFDHRHIFLDPAPDIVASFAERQRLFAVPSSDWSSYKSEIISKGGGVFSRSDKIIHLSDEIKTALDIKVDKMTPNELIKAILKAPVDLLYNGGIGTYVKGSAETSEVVGDKINEFCRVDGSELRCKIVCEGGNLGFTQAARIEFALKGGLINTDFIDNSAGVDCSDHEVNLKILLNKKIDEGSLDFETRNQLLAKMQDEVKNLVLQDNYTQALVMSWSSLHAPAYMDLYREHICRLEQTIGLNRRIEGLPSDEKLLERQLSGGGLTRPELAVLLAYTKIYLKEEIIKCPIPESPINDGLVANAFPTEIAKSFCEDLKQHPLRKEILATQLSNSVVNMMGITFPFRLQDETGASMGDIARAQTLAAWIYDVSETHKMIRNMASGVPVKTRYEFLHLIRQLINLATRWFLRNGRLTGDLYNTAQTYKGMIQELSGVIPRLVVGSTRSFIKEVTSQFVNAGLSSELAGRIAVSRVMFTALNISELSLLYGFDLIRTAEVYFSIGGKLGLVWIRDMLAKDNRSGKRNNLARLSLRDDLDSIQRIITTAIMHFDNADHQIYDIVDRWMDKYPDIFVRWNFLIKNLQESDIGDFTMLFITLRELLNMASEVCRDSSLSATYCVNEKGKKTVDAV